MNTNINNFNLSGIHGKPSQNVHNINNYVNVEDGESRGNGTLNTFNPVFNPVINVGNSSRDSAGNYQHHNLPTHIKINCKFNKK